MPHKHNFTEQRIKNFASRTGKHPSVVELAEALIAMTKARGSEQQEIAKLKLKESFAAAMREKQHALLKERYAEMKENLLEDNDRRLLRKKRKLPVSYSDRSALVPPEGSDGGHSSA
jgi:hypothetical protein